MCIVKETVILSLVLIVFLLLDPSGASLNLREASAETLTTVSEALKDLLPDAQEIKEETKVLTHEQRQKISKEAKITFDPALDREFKVFIGMNDGAVIGYVMRSAVKGKHDLIHYMVSFDPNGQIQKVVILEYHEKRGKPVAKRRFLKQFKGKTINSRLKLRKDIDGVTGATISSRGMVNGVRKMVHVFNEFYMTKTDKL